MSGAQVDELQAMQAEINGLMQRLDIAGKLAAIEQMESEASAADFWNDTEGAQKTMQQMSRLRAAVEPWTSLRNRISDALELAELDDDDLVAEMDQEVTVLREMVQKMSFQAMLSGPHDDRDAILAIHAGAGGTEAQDWAQMLERMYLRWAEQNNYKIDVIERMDGDEAGIKSVTMSISGSFAYGYLRSEQGVHRLVRISPYDSASRRHTSFAKVELWPDIQEDIDIEVNEKDLRIDTYRASGAGGQHVQKNDTAVRITHVPTGLVVQCQNQRSQAQNRERAMQILKSRLYEIELQKQEATLSELKGENVDAGWGNQIRSYVLHPYRMAKDLRTSYEVGNVSAVLDGDLNGFMEAYLRYQIDQSNVTS